jgi:protein-arginine kinase activator protein McsA
MALVLDHINGVADDNRLENLRIVCPNCAATLDTHCGRNKPLVCPTCETVFRRSHRRQRYCSHECWVSSPEMAAINGRRRKVKRRRTSSCSPTCGS